MVSDGVPGDVQCAMRCVYVREGEFSGSTRGFRLSGSDRLETILECDGDDETRSGSRSFLLQRQRVDGGDERVTWARNLSHRLCWQAATVDGVGS
jgi:hypothetical protein